MVTHSTFRNYICFNFSIPFNRNRTFAATRHVPWGSEYSKKHLRPKLIFAVCRDQRMCLVAEDTTTTTTTSIHLKVDKMQQYTCSGLSYSE